MQATIEELKKAKKFTVEDWHGVCYNHSSKNRPTRSGGYKVGEYEFTYNPINKCLYVSGNVFGKKKYQVLNSLEVMFKITQNYSLINVKLDELNFDISGIILRFNKN